MYLLLPILVALPLFFLLLHKKRHNVQFNHPPGPKGLPFIGNLHQFDSKNPHLYFSKLAKIYGPILFIRLGRVPTVVISSSKLAKEVLKTQDHNFCSRPSLVGQQKLSYNGLDIAFSPYNAYFREIRKISVVHLFSSKRVHSFAPIRQDEISRMIEKISSSLASNSKVVNLSDLLMALTSSITCRVAFGKRYDEEGIDRSRVHTLLNEAQGIFVAFFFSDYFPLMGWLDKLTGLYSKLERVFKDLDVFYEELINDRLHQDRPKFDKEDIIDVLLQLRKERSFAFDLTLDHIKAILMAFLPMETIEESDVQVDNIMNNLELAGEEFNSIEQPNEENKRSPVWLEYLVLPGKEYNDGKKRAQCKYCLGKSYIADSHYGFVSFVMLLSGPCS